jgi:dolichol-phosphate mannosyltransferase/undecaprenyl-phosphate 4-deoxy-4-formamido-L-arabinose transferase
MIAALIYYTSEDVINVETTHEVRKYGKSGYTMKRLLNQFSNLIISNSSFLLRKVSYIGILISIISFFYAAYILYRKIVIGISVEGWATITVVLLITSGLMLFSIGVIGEYLIRIINGVEKRPPYIIKQKINHEE